MSDQASTIQVNTIEPQSGTTLTVGKSGQNLVVNADSLKANVVKDAGGNAVFTSDGSGTLSGLNAGFGSAQTLIQTQTFTDQATVSFTSGIDSTYKEYIFEFFNINPANDSTYFSFQGSTNGGSSYGVTITSTYFRAYHNEAGTEDGLGYITASDNAQDTRYLPLYQSGVGTAGSQSNQADAGLSGTLKLYTPSSTTYVKQFMATTNGMANDIGTKENFIGGYFNTTSAIDAISFKQSTGNFDGKIKLYGIK